MDKKKIHFGMYVTKTLTTCKYSKCLKRIYSYSSLNKVIYDLGLSVANYITNHGLLFIIGAMFCFYFHIYSKKTFNTIKLIESYFRFVVSTMFDTFMYIGSLQKTSCLSRHNNFIYKLCSNRYRAKSIVWFISYCNPY